ncbi:LacI family DNA-binding transcriptional regulator [Hyphobacterium sp. HN65]|uniref:LacI family DNA-binding transcriptional regulator n=1 Tax=Hyphobacterium lacteum TaxID=3116575 RepID=A0ABU7LSG2_9PROT|nr:LacI family DNA-binding transcriptional regulator [Hyphobacterium sp. HN65]MEE2526838.1 LacI family DNA-binding transcriptional regulator [Hyphobacterium sp. HN65]
MNKKQKITIQDVAEMAAVSPMTVSRVLNNKGVVKEATRKRVQEAMRALKYRPNLMARNLAGRSGLFLGLIYRNPSYGYLSEFLLGALNTCRRLGHNLVVEEPFIDRKMVDLELIERRFLDTSIQALIVVPPLSDDPQLIDVLERIKIPYVCVSPRLDHYAGPGVGITETEAAREMTEYLLDLGHERIGFIKGPPDHRASELRLTGYKQAFEARGLAVDPGLIGEGDFTYVSGMRAAKALLESTNRPTAIFASNDDMAFGVINAVHRSGLSVPDDMSVVGFDDTPAASATWPPLTTIHQPIRELASAAIEMLERLVEQSASDTAVEPEKLRLAHKLVVRESAGPPPAGTG